MFKPGEHYQSKGRYWLVFQTQKAPLVPWESSACAPGDYEALVVESAIYFTNHFHYPVTFISPGSCFTVVEVFDKYVKVIGETVGWIVAHSSVRDLHKMLEQLDEHV